MNEWNKIILSPQEFHDKILKLAEMIPKGKYKYVYGIPRGGLIVAVYLSHYCNIGISYDFPEKNFGIVLIADDISDTGKTLIEFKTRNFDIATIHYKPRSIVKPTYFVEQCKNDDWIVYPYECTEEKPNREL